VSVGTVYEVQRNVNRSTQSQSVAERFANIQERMTFLQHRTSQY